MSKVNISLPDGLKEEIDLQAEAADTTRSGFLRDAAAHYITALDEQAVYDARVRRVGGAMEKMHLLARAVGAPGAAEVFRDLRDAKPRWVQR